MFLVYFAGELFSSKHLMGNAALADAIAKASNRRFRCLLPQTLEDRETTAQAIRDKDIVTLLGCDLALFNFDGPELDSGTVTEFMLAKFADIPSLLLRTDFRRGGDHGEDQWNLMLSFYPRTKSLFINSMEIYKTALSNGSDPMQAAHQLIDQIAGMAVEELDRLVEQKPTISNELAEPVFRWLGKMPGFIYSETEEKVKEAFVRKHANGLLP
jgi:nucleoside 2-deoxyribosyltransferase